MHSLLNGERKPRNTYLTVEARSSALAEPRQFAGDFMEWTGDLSLSPYLQINPIK